ncbi:MAG: ANTAR domain-containing protein [Mycobacteriaceae bacterium]
MTRNRDAGLQTDLDGGTVGIDAVDYVAAFAAMPSPCVLLNTEFVICEINDACLAATERTRSDLLGQDFFAAFPENANTQDADGIRNVRASFQRVLETGRSNSMWVQRYDIAVPGTPGVFQERHWSPLTVPVLGPDGAVKWIIQRVEDVTDVRDDLTGALAFHRNELDEDPGNDADRARRFADCTALSMTTARMFADVVAEAEQLREAMSSRAVIEQAKGIIMAQRRCGGDAAFAVLVQLSNDTNRKLRDVAAALVDTAPGT